jgi:hypothetical protein
VSDHVHREPEYLLSCFIVFVRVEQRARPGSLITSRRPWVTRRESAIRAACLSTLAGSCYTASVFYSRTRAATAAMSVLDVLREVYTNLQHSSTPLGLPAGGEQANGTEPMHLNERSAAFIESGHRPNHDVKMEPRTLRDRPAGSGSAAATSKKRKRSRDERFGDASYFEWTEELMAEMLPESVEDSFATSIFELGLRNSSPKVMLTVVYADAYVSAHTVVLAICQTPVCSL